MSRVKTVLTVLVLSCLIWVFAEQAVTIEDEVVVGIELSSLSEEILVQYLDENGVAVNEPRQSVKLTVRGPTGRIQAVNKEYTNTVRLNIREIGLDLEAIETAKEYNVPVMAILKEGLYSRDRQSHLQVTGSEPESVLLRVTKLTPALLPVHVYSQDGARLAMESVEPTHVNSYIFEGKPTEARILLSAAEQRQAAEEQITTTAYATLPNRVKDYSYPVKVKLSEEGRLKTMEIKQPRLGVLMPSTMQGRYKVVYDPSQLDEYKPIECIGTAEAFEKYSKSDFHLVLIINETDEGKAASSFSRTLSYYIPTEYGELEAIEKTPKVPIRFRLEKVEEKVLP